MNLGGMGRSKSPSTVPLRSAGTRVRLAKLAGSTVLRWPPHSRPTSNLLLSNKGSENLERSEEHMPR